MRHKGFTIVELAIVIIVIAILAGIVLVSYSFLQRDAIDAKIRSTVKTAGDALTLYESKNQARIAGTGYFDAANSIDTLVPTYLKTGYRDGLTSKNAASATTIFRWYNCANADNGFVIYASLSNPTPDDTAAFTSIRTACGHNDTQAPTTGTNKYNYAQLF